MIDAAAWLDLPRLTLPGLGLASVVVTALVAAVTILMLATVMVGATGRARRRRTAARREGLARHIRPLISEALDYAETDSAASLDAAVRALSPAAGETLDDLVVALVPKLRGTERELLVRLLGIRGTVARVAVDGTSRRSSRRLAAAEFLGAVDDGANLPALVRLLDDRDEAVRLAAVRAIGRIGSAAAVPILLDQLDRTDDARRLPVHAVTMAILRCGSAAAPHLISALQTGAKGPRLAAAQLLGWLGELSAAPALRTTLTDHEPEVRVAAVEAIGRIGLADVTHDLARLLVEDSPVPLRRAAATALGRIADPSACHVLGHVVANDTDPRVGYAAARALPLLGPTGIEELTGAIAVSAAAREVLDVLRARDTDPSTIALAEASS